LNDNASAERIALGTRICNAGAAKRSEIVIVSVTSGVAARYVSFFQPAQRIVAVTHDINLARQLVLSKGIYPFVLQNQIRKELEDFILATRAIHIANHIAPSIAHPTAFLKRSDRAKESDRATEIAKANPDVTAERFIVPRLRNMPRQKVNQKTESTCQTHCSNSNSQLRQDIRKSGKSSISCRCAIMSDSMRTWTVEAPN
jgi:hypothetical protein